MVTCVRGTLVRKLAAQRIELKQAEETLARLLAQKESITGHSLGVVRRLARQCLRYHQVLTACWWVLLWLRRTIAPSRWSKSQTASEPGLGSTVR